MSIWNGMLLLPQVHLLFPASFNLSLFQWHAFSFVRISLVWTMVMSTPLGGYSWPVVLCV